jgi:hypothetical protein
VVKPLITILPVAVAQEVGLVGVAVMVGIGFTVIVNVFDAPLQATPSFVLGVTIIVAVTEVLPVLMAAKDPMLPVPLAASPMVELVFVQE